MALLTQRPETDDLRELVDGLEGLMTKSICVKLESNYTMIQFEKPSVKVDITADEVEMYTNGLSFLPGLLASD